MHLDLKSCIIYIYMVHTYILYILAACYKLYSYSSIFVHCFFFWWGVKVMKDTAIVLFGISNEKRFKGWGSSDHQSAKGQSCL